MTLRRLLGLRAKPPKGTKSKVIYQAKALIGVKRYVVQRSGVFGGWEFVGEYDDERFATRTATERSALGYFDYRVVDTQADDE